MEKIKKIFKFIAYAFEIYGFIFLFNYIYTNNLFGIAEYVPQFSSTVVGATFGIIFVIFFSYPIARWGTRVIRGIEEMLVKMNLRDLVASLIGGIIGLAIANLIGLALSGLGVAGTVITVFLNISLGYIGFRVARKKKDEVSIPQMIRKPEIKKENGKPKILDTSVIIDGRILDILHTGFIEGKIIIPSFVLEELRHIADSSDSLKRNRGRRGLDILNEIQKQTSVTVEIMDFEPKEYIEVDSKLLKMAQAIDGCVVTNDYNLNKVAEFQGVCVLNINELANAVKPMVLPGEDISVTAVKSGKESGQGVAYLNDGTMIVIDGGSRYIGDTIFVTVTSVLQTAVGRMIFAKIKTE